MADLWSVLNVPRKVPTDADEALKKIEIFADYDDKFLEKISHDVTVAMLDIEVDRVSLIGPVVGTHGGPRVVGLSYTV